MFNVPRNSLCFMLAVICMLFFATVFCRILRMKNAAKDYTELQQRIRSWWIMICLLFFVLINGERLSIVFFGLLSFLALKEFLSIVPTRCADRRVIFWAYLSIPIQYYWVAIHWYGMFIIFIPVYIFLFLPIRMILTGETKGFIRSAGIIHWGAMLTVFSCSHITYLLTLPVKNHQAGNIGLVLFLLFMTEFNDVSQYIWGKSFGRRKIIPKISPNKTYEGFVGGVATFTCCAAFIAPLLTPITTGYGFLAGLIISISGFFGDVVLSSVKRDLQIKNSGALIPGHGGILDRMDSLFYTAPLFFHFTYYMYY